MADTNVTDVPPTSAQLGTYDYGPMIQASMWTLAAASGTTLFFRIGCKIVKGLMWWDDYVLIIAWIFLFANVALVHELVVLGFGRPPPAHDQLVIASRVGLVAATFLIASTGISKTSFAITLLRLTSGKTRKLVWAILFSINISMGLAGLFLWIQCIPLQKTWDPLVQGACWNHNIQPTYARFASAWSGTMDIMLAMLPWKIIWNLKLDKKDKFGIAIAMSLGVFAGMAAFTKVSKMSFDLRSSGFSTYTGYTLTIWASVEPAATITASSIPVLRVLFTHKIRATEIDRPERSSQFEISKTIECGPNKRGVNPVHIDPEMGICVPRDKEKEIRLTWFDWTNEDVG